MDGKKEDKPYINQDLQNAFKPKINSPKPSNKKEAVKKKKIISKSTKTGKMQKWEKFYWPIPIGIYLLILALGIRDDPADSGSHEVLLTIFVAFLIALVIFGIFGIPVWLFKKYKNPKPKNKKGYVNDNISSRFKWRYDSEAVSNNRKWLYTIILIIISPFTYFISLIFIRYVWVGRFLFKDKQPRFRQSSRERHYRRWAFAIGILVICLVAYKPVSNAVILQMYSSNASDSIKDIANNSGFNNTGKIIFYETHPELVNADTLNAECPNDDESVIEYGCFLPTKNKMYILQVADNAYKDIEYTTAAHETLHAAYALLNSSDRNSINSQILNFYNDKNNPESVVLHDKLKPYGTDSFDVNDELHSFIGSESDVTSLSETLNNYYDRYFKDRAVPVTAKSEFKLKIDNETSYLDSEYEILNSIVSEIDTYKAEHLDNIKAAMNRADYYGDVYSYNRNVDAYNHNLDYYNSRIVYYNQRKDTYNTRVDDFNAVLSAFYPTKALINNKQ